MTSTTSRPRTKRPYLLAGTLALTATAVIIGQLGAESSRSAGAPSRSDAREGRGGPAAGTSKGAAAARASGGGVAGTIGPDVIVGSLQDTFKYGTVSGISAYAIGTTSCNVGDEELSWFDSGPNDSLHPVIAQNLYRLKGGRFEQIGQSWLKHGWCAIDGDLCGSCESDGGCDYLGIGCSDPYGATLNGTTSDLGPRSQVNASTGVFPFPFTAPSAPMTIGRRLQVKIDDLNPALNADSLYFGEGHYVHPEDAAAGNDNNNASYRRITVGALSGGAYALTLTGATVQQLPAIYAWKNNGLGVGVPDPDVTIIEVDVPGDGRFLVASKVSQNPDQTWHYEYAIQNLCSDASGQAFSLPLPDGVVVTNQGFHGTFAHSGEPYSNTPWTMAADGGVISWATQTFAENPNANALRFSTLYNFRFDADTPPIAGTGTLALFKNIGQGPMTFDVPVPSTPEDPSIPGDLNDDGMVDGADLSILLGAWGTPDADLDGNGDTDGADLSILLGQWM